jgi:hypothetical protein
MGGNEVMQVADGGWRMANGEWRMANGEWRDDRCAETLSIPYFAGFANFAREIFGPV